MCPQDPKITNSQCKVISIKIAPLSKEFIGFFACIPLIMLHTILSNSPDTQIGQSHLAGICWPPCHGWKGSCMTNIDIPSFKKTFFNLPTNILLIGLVSNSSGDLCKSGPRRFSSEKKFCLKLCPLNYHR